MVREWQYWTRNKLRILEGYLPAFNRASTRSPERVYIDLMAGQPENRGADNGEMFDGSARIALASDPGFTRLAFCEQEPNATRLRKDLTARFPGRSWKVYPGDCNVTVDRVLADLSDVRWAPTFAFVDQQAREVKWETLAKLATFRKNSRNLKTELWILASPAMIAKGVKGTNGDSFAEQVDQLYGTDAWRRIQAARDDRTISAANYRDEMVNLLRWRLEKQLGYAMTARIPMNMPTRMPIYDMVFATDHWVGNKIMSDLYLAAAQREPRMLAEAKDRAARKREQKLGLFPLFEVDVDVDELPAGALAWTPTPCWDPESRPWWAS
ncbi:three-Cys-motif partner protein TcmP [Actinomycetes bacterium KLBMP 9759]